MAKKLFPEHERYLLENWTDAVDFEASMNLARDTHRRIIEKSLGKVRAEHEELDTQALHLEYPAEYDLNAGVGKKEWPDYGKNWPTGFWLGGIRLENLTSEDEERPYACIYVAQKTPDRDFLDDVAEKISRAARDFLSSDQLRGVEVLDSSDRQHQRMICWPLLESRSGLLNLLLDDEAKGFVSRIAEHIEFLTQFAPVMDDIFRTAKRSRK